MRGSGWGHGSGTICDISDMPAITLLPAKMVNDLRVIAEYLVKAPGENHTGRSVCVCVCVCVMCCLCALQIS